MCCAQHASFDLKMEQDTQDNRLNYPLQTTAWMQNQQANNLLLQQKRGGPPSLIEDSPPQANALQ